MPNHCFGQIEFHNTKKDFDLLLNSLNDWTFCNVVYPQPDEVKKDSINEDTYREENEKLYDLKKNWVITEDEFKIMDDDLLRKYPHNQLWYDWNRKHRWTKRWIYNQHIKDNDKDTWYIYVLFDTAWNELSEDVIKKATTMFDCDIEYNREENMWCFSWTMIATKWKITSREDYNDPYYWKGKCCSVCKYMYSEDGYDRYDTEKWICNDCAHNK